MKKNYSTDESEFGAHIPQQHWLFGGEDTSLKTLYREQFLYINIHTTKELSWLLAWMKFMKINKHKRIIQCYNSTITGSSRGFKKNEEKKSQICYIRHPKNSNFTATGEGPIEL